MATKSNDISLGLPSEVLTRFNDHYDLSRPRVTGYRILVSLLIASFGIWKSATVYLGEHPISTSFEWTIFAFVALCIYLLGLCEQYYPTRMPWLFGWDFLSIISRTSDFTEEGDLFMLSTASRPRLSGFHILVCSTLLEFGAAKAVLTYFDYSTTPVAIEWATSDVAALWSVPS
ncbi:hypothetical protein JAAARDRAFT_141799 [Jaapia argillacea MUCL 33604]|uniref:Uncharacterized protein n=1 Tax=Jaapia argillacea MUCL 33604 TaxID=933084 RepID=A0A067P737_9AGAM|nr:hypothetical protein JAAARDRAFT_141799 [Jaapia argillacea MUCL 33604]